MIKSSHLSSPDLMITDLTTASMLPTAQESLLSDTAVMRIRHIRRGFFAAALGFFVFGDVPDVLSVIGYVLICGAGVGMFVYNKRRTA